MKKTLIFITITVLLTMLLSACSQESTDNNKNEADKKNKLTVALSDDYPPMEFRDDANQLVGFDIDLIDALSVELDTEIEIITTAWDGLFVGLDAGKYDMVISATSITPERLEAYEQSDPYLASGQVVVIHKGNQEIKALEDLAGKKIGVQSESAGAAAAEKQRSAIGYEITSYDESVSVFNDLKTERLDASVVDYGVAMEYIANNPDDYAITKIMLSNEPLAVTIKKGNLELKDKVNKALANLSKTGKLKEISEKWFDADYTSDIPKDIE